MSRPIRRIGVLLISAACVSCPLVQGQNSATGTGSKHPPFAKAGTPRQTERIRFFDVKHIKAELAIDTQKHRLSGVVTQTLSPLHPHLTQLELDCGPDLKVAKVTVGANATPCSFETKGGKLSIKLDKAYGLNDTIDVAIGYSGSPARGLYFPAPEAPYPKKTLSFWTQGESEDTRCWLPCYDYPNERATSEMI